MCDVVHSDATETMVMTADLPMVTNVVTTGAMVGTDNADSPIVPTAVPAVYQQDEPQKRIQCRNFCGRWHWTLAARNWVRSDQEAGWQFCSHRMRASDQQQGLA